MVQPRSTLAAGALSVLAVAALAVTAAPASAAPPADGCARGYTLVSVADFAAEGYRVPGIVDDPANTYGFGHQAGNGDGWACAHLLGRTENGAPLYLFLDNTLPSSP